MKRLALVVLGLVIATPLFAQEATAPPATAPASDKVVRAVFTTAVTNRVINGDKFYFVEVVFPPGINVDVLGLKIVHLPTC